MKSYLKKIVILTLATLIFAAPASIGPGFNMHKNEAKALTTVVRVAGGWVDLIKHIPSLEAPANTTAAATTNIAGQQKLEYIEKLALANLKRHLINLLVDDIIDWINGGGEPKFITDWESFLNEAAGIAVGSVVEDIGLGFLCHPFSTQVQISLSGQRRFTEEITCTLDDIVSNIENFYYDFTDGGWIAYYESWQPRNNYFGAYLLAQEEAERRAFDATLAAQNEGIAGGGVLSTRSCEESGPNLPSSGADIDGDGTYGDRKCTITTPGSVVQDLLSKGLTAEIDLILESEGLSGYVADIANALISRLIREGVNGLRGLTTRSNPGNDFVPPSDPEGICDRFTGEMLEACLSYQGVLDVSFTSSRDQLLSDIGSAVASRKVALETMKDTRTLWQEQLTLINEELDDENPCEEAEDFKGIAESEIEVLDIQIQVEEDNITALEETKIQIELIEDNAWDKLVELEVSLAGTANISIAESLESRVLDEKEVAKQTIEDQVDACNL